MSLVWPFNRNTELGGQDFRIQLLDTAGDPLTASGLWFLTIRRDVNGKSGPIHKTVAGDDHIAGTIIAPNIVEFRLSERSETSRAVPSGYTEVNLTDEKYWVGIANEIAGVRRAVASGSLIIEGGM